MGLWPGTLHVASPCGLGFPKIWWLGSVGKGRERQRGGRRERVESDGGRERERNREMEGEREAGNCPMPLP